MGKIKVGVVQGKPVLFDLEGSLAVMKRLVEEIRDRKYQLLLFPEAFIPGYPRGTSFGTIIGKRSQEGREMFKKYALNSIEVPGIHTQGIGDLAKMAECYLVVGVSERDTVSGTLYCTMLYFGPNGSFLGKHRKIKPTGAERIIWGEGDGSTLLSFDTSIGKIGGLICWENYMPLARMSMYSKGVQIYLAPTADDRASWITTLQHIAREGRCYVLGCNQFVRKDDFPDFIKAEIKDQPEFRCHGGSVIIDPAGEIVEGPLWDREGILSAELDLNEIIKAKMEFDPVGHYARNDIFNLTIGDQPDIRKA